MSQVLTDAEIALYLREAKHFPDNWKTRLQEQPKAKMDHSQRSMDIAGENGSEFSVFIRRSDTNSDDWSIGLRVKLGDGSGVVLVRYNGPSHKHTNHIEKKAGDLDSSFKNRHHIHIATERYLSVYGARGKELMFAEPTDDFHSFDSAMDHFTRNNGIVAKGSQRDDRQMRLPLDD